MCGEPFELAPGEPLHEVDRATARRFFDDLMAARERRKAALEELLAINGASISTDDVGLQRLDDWYAGNVEASADERGRLAPRWYAVGLDIGLYLGDAVIERSPGVRWELFTAGRRDVSYQRPVLLGFKGVENPNHNVDPEVVVGGHGRRIVAGGPEPADVFVGAVRRAAARA